MKIEIGESLIFSWLRHVMGCPITRANWKPSPTWPIRREPELATDFERMREIAGQRLGFEIFKQSSFQQFMRQAEIDVLGLRLDGPGTTAIAVDSAFHEGGVSYGDRKETVGRILKKLIRTAFALEAYFDLHQADIVFATPNMRTDVQDDLQNCWPALQSVLADCDTLSASRMNLRVVANGDLAVQIMQAVLDRRDQVADTSELFLRAQQLVRSGAATTADGPEFRFGAARNRRRGQDRRRRAANHDTTRSGRPVEAGGYRQAPRCSVLQNDVQPGASLSQGGRAVF